MPACDWRQGLVVSTIQSFLGTFIHSYDLGLTFGPGTGFLIARDPDTVRALDFAFIAKEHLPTVKPTEAFWPGAPDLAVEVVSPSDRTGEVVEKIEAWLAAGSAAVWMIDPQLQTVTIYRSRTDIQIKTVGDTLEGATLVPGFTCPISELFR